MLNTVTVCEITIFHGGLIFTISALQLYLGANVCLPLL